MRYIRQQPSPELGPVIPQDPLPVLYARFTFLAGEDLGDGIPKKHIHRFELLKHEEHDRRRLPKIILTILQCGQPFASNIV